MSTIDRPLLRVAGLYEVQAFEFDSVEIWSVLSYKLLLVARRRDHVVHEFISPSSPWSPLLAEYESPKTGTAVRPILLK
ncbi:jg26639 [Pararge aegeria aegeria]|uniref:Jg26639 protein n=1 Tax=Pararge aegeria aegeria TaxID=348720 RepID=A0A8S4R173_9NEOP|nr:jg26639 [Pararge aegeria aegeria]